jgi:hypothetical protein
MVLPALPGHGSTKERPVMISCPKAGSWQERIFNFGNDYVVARSVLCDEAIPPLDEEIASLSLAMTWRSTDRAREHNAEKTGREETF